MRTRSLCPPAPGLKARGAKYREEATVRRSLPRHLAVGAIFALRLPQSAASGANVARAASGDLIADVVLPEPYPRYTSPSVASDGRYLYYTEYGGSTLHRIHIPPAGRSGPGPGGGDA